MKKLKESKGDILVLVLVVVGVVAIIGYVVNH